jgi:hypothetical protein
MSQNEPAKSIEALAEEILANLQSRSWHQRERVAYSEANWVPVEEVNAQLKEYLEKHATPDQLAVLKSAPFMK